MSQTVFCDVGRPTSHISRGTLDTGPGYVLTGDYETSFLAPNHYEVTENPYEGSVSISDILRKTVPEFEGRRGRFVISVTFIQDPYGDGIECEASRCRTCDNDRPWDDPEPPPPAPEDCCAFPKEVA